MKKISLLILLFTGIVNAQLTLNTPTDYVVCNQNGFGTSDFDLAMKDPEILGALNPADYVVTYYYTQEDAESNLNNITVGFADSSFPTIIYVRVQNISEPIDFGLTTLTLIVNNSPFINAAIPYLVVNETQFDGIGTFDLTDNEASVVNGQNDVIVTYHTSLEDAQTLSNAIANPTSFLGTHLQTIWIALQNGINGCSNYASFQLKVFDLNNIVPIPDNNFKTVLLNELLNIGFTLQPNGLFENVIIDANNDGEIQVSEAELINGLNISNSNITDLTGIEAFVNLINFNGTLNPITNINLLNGLTNLKSIQCINCSLETLDLSSLQNLQYLDCTVNQITDLNLTGLSNLVSVRCDGNQLSSLDLSPSSVFEYLSCTNNFITVLDTSMLPNLLSLYTTGNQLSTLNLSNNSNLKQLSCGSQDTFTDIDLTGLLALETLEINKSLQTSLDISANDLLYDIQIKNTAIEAIDISNTVIISGVISNNPNLVFLNLKNGITTSNPGISFCPSLTYVCANEQEIITTYNNMINPSFGNNPNVEVNSYCSFSPGGDYNSIVGNQLFDQNNNGCDNSDLPFPNLKIKIDDGTNEGATFTDTIGDYKFYTQAGTFTVTPVIENPTFFNFDPANVVVNFPVVDNSITTQNFCISPNGIHPDLEIVLAPITPARPGFDATYKIVYKNIGNQTLSGDVNFTYDDAVLDYISASTPQSSQFFGGVTWTYSNLLPFESRSIFVTMNVNSPTETPPVNVDDQLTYTVTSYPVGGDESISNNTFQYDQTVVAFYFPNDITCLGGETVSPTEIGNYLNYMVNFENTGNAVAENVVVTLNIDTDKFDIESLQLLESSNPLYTRVAGNKVEFIFENIQLTGPGGHGNILLKIRTKSSLSTGDVVYNRANIYFGYNAPVTTLEFDTTFETLGLNNPDADNSIAFFPNPTSNFVTVQSKNTIKSMQLFDVQGRLLQTNFSNQNETKIDVSAQSNGIYFVKVTTDKGTKVERIIKE